jgi:hypothetical protein
MASTAVHIPDMGAAIAAGDVPGAFADGRAVFEFPTLTYTSARGATHAWTIRVRLLGPDGEYVPIPAAALAAGAGALADHKAEITVESAQRGGKIRDVVPTYVSAGKNLGRKNATNCVTQAIRDALGLYNRQRKRADIVAGAAAGAAAGAVAGVAAARPPRPRRGSDEAPPESDDEEGGAAARTPPYDPRPPPMLVKKAGEGRDAVLGPADFAAGVVVQRKLNGVRFVATAGPEPGTVICYSRTGTLYPAHPRLIAELAPILAGADAAAAAAAAAGGDPAAASAPYLDGELYLHGKSLSWISGQARRGDRDEMSVLAFHVFDVFFPGAKAAGHDMPGRHRRVYLDALFAASGPHPLVVRVENFPAADDKEVNDLAARFIGEGYEGAIARKDEKGYQYGYSNFHSSNLIKIKPTFDAEFIVVGYTQGTRGKDVGAIIWECEVADPPDPSDRRFTVVPKDMAYEDRYALFRCLSKMVPAPGGASISRFERDIRGLPLTVEYREVSAKTGKPLQAKALAFRTYEAGSAADPIRIILEECRRTK